jgi:hypothetical protein
VRTTRLTFELNFLASFVYWCSRASLYGCWYSGFPQSKVLRSSIEEEYELAAHMPGPALLQRLACLLTWEGALEPHGDLSGVDDT